MLTGFQPDTVVGQLFGGKKSSANKGTSPCTVMINFIITQNSRNSTSKSDMAFDFIHGYFLHTSRFRYTKHNTSGIQHVW